MRLERPRFAWVLWPDSFDPTVPSCISLDGIAAALKRGAILVGVEDEELCLPKIDVSSMHQNPRRTIDPTEDEA